MVRADFAVGDRLHLERVELAEIGDLLEGQRGVLDQPDGGRLGHQWNCRAHNPLPFAPRGGPPGEACVMKQT